MDNRREKDAIKGFSEWKKKKIKHQDQQKEREKETEKRKKKTERIKGNRRIFSAKAAQRISIEVYLSKNEWKGKE